MTIKTIRHTSTNKGHFNYILEERYNRSTKEIDYRVSILINGVVSDTGWSNDSDKMLQTFLQLENTNIFVK
jgi:uncharacterized protein with WD repeat